GGSNPFASSIGCSKKHPGLLSTTETSRFQNTQLAGEVAKRSNAADCKSVALAASKVRVLPSPPSVRTGELVNGWIGELVNDGRIEFRQLTRPPTHQAGEFGIGGSNSVVESQPSKLLVAGSIPVSRSKRSGHLVIWLSGDWIDRLGNVSADSHDQITR